LRCTGAFGEDGTVQGALELMGIAYTGSGVMASSAIAIDKVMTKRVWRGRRPADPGLPVWLQPRTSSNRRACVIAPCPTTLGLPLIVKPARVKARRSAWSRSMGYSQMQDGGATFRPPSYDSRRAVREQFIRGRRSDLPDASAAARCAACVASDPHRRAGRCNYDYQNKYFTDDVTYQCPSGLPETEEREIQRIVLASYRALGCRGWGRADLMIRASDRKPFLLEMNTSPGMTGHSLVPMSARAAGISYDELCVRLLQSATLDYPPAGGKEAKV
jgi:D-alanine-D-alanine ligase